MLRGSPSPLTKLLGNPHVAPGLRQLRAALYSLLRLPVRRESWPERDNVTQTVVWTDLDADELRDRKWVNLLLSPREALTAVFPNANVCGPPSEATVAQWENHCFAQRVLVYELCAFADPECFELLDLMMAHGKGS